MHAVEIDPVLAGPLPHTVAGHAGPALPAGSPCTTADALRIAAAELADPAPTALVANLPYNVAVPVVLHLLAELPSLRHGLVMVQKEVADRLVAGPGSKVYGVPRSSSPGTPGPGPPAGCPPSVFWPVPNVDSGLVAFTRREPPRADVRPERRLRRGRRRLRASAARCCAPPWPPGPAARTGPRRRSTAAGVDPGARGESARPWSSSPRSPRRPAAAPVAQ